MQITAANCGQAGKSRGEISPPGAWRQAVVLGKTARPESGSSGRYHPTMRRIVWVIVWASMLSGCGYGASRGTMPPPDANGDWDPSAVPDFVSYVGQADRIIGWIPKAFILDPNLVCDGPECDGMPVYGDDLSTLIGHDVPGRGFVPLGVDPTLVPERPVQQGPSVGP